MLLLSVHQSDSETLLVPGSMDVPEVCHYGQFELFSISCLSELSVTYFVIAAF